MKQILKTALMVSVLATSASALAGPKGDHCDHHKHHGGMGLGKLERMIDLSEAQKTQLAEIEKQMKTERHPGGRKHRGAGLMALDPAAADYQQQVNERAERAAEMARQRVLKRAEIHQQVQAILTDEQKTQLKTKRAEMQAKWKERRKDS